MTNAITVVDDRDEISLAYMVHNSILERRFETAMNLIALGELFKSVRDNKLYLHLGCESFTEYIGTPEIAFQPSTVYSFIGIYEKYVDELSCDHKVLAGIGHHKLQIIKPIVADNPPEWIEKAKVLSRSDLRNEVREAQGLEPHEYSVPVLESGQPTIAEPPSYIEYATQHPCITCGARTEEHPHHFPKTRGAGAVPWHVIPLCGVCHNEAGQMGVDTFITLYRNSIFNYFYNTIGRFFNEGT